MSKKDQASKIGKYEILGKIGEGGFGIVYRGRDPMLDREVAIKVLRADLASTPGFLERFRREARLAASLHHPNVVGIIEVGEHEGRYYLVMEYLTGQTLADLLDDGKSLPLTRAVELLHPLAEALDYAHAKGVIHRDVKPGNVILADDGKRPVLTDFGLVKSRLEEGTTTTGVVLGTPEYMSPEQIQGKELGPAADQYALGIIAYQMLTGRVPFKGTTPFEVQNGHVSQPPPDPLSLNPALSLDTGKLLLRALEKDPSNRFQSVIGFVNELNQVVDQWISQKANQILQEVQQQMASMNFDNAIAGLDQLQAIAPSAKAAALLNECQRKKEKWNQIQDLLKQQDQVSDQINKMIKAEQWIKLPSKNGGSYAPQKEKETISAWLNTKVDISVDKGLFGFVILFTLVALVFAINLGYQAPSIEVIKSLCSRYPLIFITLLALDS